MVTIGTLIVEVKAMRHRAICKRGHERRSRDAEPQYRALGRAAGLAHDINDAAYGGHRSTCGEAHAKQVENTLLGGVDRIIRQGA